MTENNLFDPSRKKKKKHRRRPVEEIPEESSGPSESEGSSSPPPVPVLTSSGEYTYDYLLHRLYDALHQVKPEDVPSSTFKVPHAIAFGAGSKTLWANFPALCRVLNRDPFHVLSFVSIELGTAANLDGKGRLLVRGRFRPPQLDELAQKYVTEYVLCHTCQGRETILEKGRGMLFVVCESSLCGSSRSVPLLQKGYVHRLKKR